LAPAADAAAETGKKLLNMLWTAAVERLRGATRHSQDRASDKPELTTHNNFGPFGLTI
jgi:hypothetical protein